MINKTFRYSIRRSGEYFCIFREVDLTNSNFFWACEHVHKFFKIVTWLILPVVICLSQRLSHACLSINDFIQWNCEWLIKSVIVYLIIPYYLDNRGNSRANTCYTTRLLEGWYWLDTKPIRATGSQVIHNHFSNRMALRWRWFIQISALSTFDGRIEAYHGFNG